MNIETRLFLTLDVQARSSSQITHYESVKDAYNAWIRDSTIWKISWKNHRFRPKLKNDTWHDLSEQKLCELSLAYATASENQLFWVDQAVIPPNIDDLFNRKKSMSDAEYDDLYMKECIIEVITDNEFQKRYI
jgi:hypothetical protein